MPTSWISTASECEKLTAELIGGKALHLSRVAAAGMRVPAWFCITTVAFDHFRRRAGPKVEKLLLEASQKRGRDALRVADELSQLLRQVCFDDTQAEALLAAFDRHFGPRARVAVRSSAVNEDSIDASYAGQMRSHLNVDRARLLSSIVDCMLSPLSAGCIDYRRLKGGRHHATGCAVVVQEMVHPRASGVLFTVNPVAPLEEQLVITAAYGLGEGAVQDLAEVDTVLVSRRDGSTIDARVAFKTRMVVARAEGRGGTLAVPVDERSAARPVLSAAEVAQLHCCGMALERRFGCPQDVEWAITGDGELHVLQARPVTTPKPRLPQVFDSSNISENYRGATTPLTFSYVRRYYDDIFSSVARMFGTSETALTRHRSVFRDLVAFVDGGLYYNLANWYRMFELVPGFPYFARPFEHGVGIEGVPVDLREQVATFGTLRQRSALRLVSTHLRIVANYVSLPFRFSALRRRYSQVRHMLTEQPVAPLSLEQLADRYEAIQVELRPNWGAALLNDYYAFIFFHALYRLGSAWGFDKDGSLLADLLRSQEELASVGPVKALLDLARVAKDTPGLPELILDEGALGSAAIASDPRFSRFAAELDQYVQRFGDRRFDELKLESPTLQEDPDLIVALLRNYLRSQSVSSAHEKFQDRGEARAGAQRAVSAALAAQPMRKLVLSLLLAATRKALAYREFGRRIRSQRCALEREVILEIAARLVEAGALMKQSDVYFLTLDEIADYVAGASVTRTLGPLVAHRRAEYAQHQKCLQPLRVTALTPVYSHSHPVADPPPRELAADDGRATLTGIGCSPGRVTGRARIVSNPYEVRLERGDILVTRSTDPAWAFLMAAASALVVERGNLLSHAAIIGREIGIPCVIGLTSATVEIPEGALLTVDGTRGTVQIEAAPRPVDSSQRISARQASDLKRPHGPHTAQDQTGRQPA